MTLLREYVKNKERGWQTTKAQETPTFNETEAIVTMCEKYHKKDMREVDSLVIQNKIDQLVVEKL